MISFIRKIFPYICICAASFFSVFYFNQFALQEELKYRPLANGWVSIYPGFHLDNSQSIIGRIAAVVEEDLVHGRFRPAFFTYISTSYFLSPVVHGRLGELSERSYLRLMTGDLRIFSSILLASVALSMALLSFVICRITGTPIFTLLPIIFIPLSPTLTENLLQNYIDSQEILLVLLISLWFFLLFFSLVIKNFFWRIFLFLSSIVALSLAFLSKETAIVIFGVALLLSVFIYWTNRNKTPTLEPILSVKVITTLIFSFSLTILVLTVTMLNKAGYASDGYQLNPSKILASIKTLWGFVTNYSLFHIYSYVAIGCALIILFFRRKNLINGISINIHYLVACWLLFLTLGFFAILVPWDPLLAKYVYPCVFFFSFLVGYALSVIYAAFTVNKKYFSWVIILVLLVPFVFVYSSLFKKAEYSRNYLATEANYGVSVIPQIAENIIETLDEKNINELRVLVHYHAGEKWKHSIAWSKLHLCRWLNIESRINIIDHGGDAIENIKMPSGELTSFRFDESKPSLYISEKKKELDQLTFDIVYQAYLSHENPVEVIEGVMGQYRLLEVVAEFPRKPHFQSFKVYKYIPIL